MTPRVTQRDVARKAGVSHVTVSLALRHDPGIPEKTRKRIEKIAKTLGYAPDPMLTALSSYRKQRRPAAYHANIAWLINNPGAGSTAIGDFRCYYDGAKARAEQLGYVLEEINLLEYADPKRLRRLLEARNITGLVLTPSLPTGSEFRFDLSHYSAVRLGYSYRYPFLNTVANSQFRTALTTMQKVAAMGYRRIGTILNEEVDERTSWHFLGGYLAGQHFVPRENWITPFYDVPGIDLAPAVLDWIAREKIDCFIAAGYVNLHRALLERGLDIPGQVGYANTQILEEDTFFSGIHQNSRQIGVAAINLLVSMMHAHETGVPAIPSNLLIEGSWREGKTLMKQKPQA
jgi:DNA-binding LacI/PurR family transcriptional regulator